MRTATATRSSEVGDFSNKRTFWRHPAGKFVPELGRKIYEENESGNPDIEINLVGVGIGDGFMSPVDTAVVADYLYEVRREGEAEEEEEEKGEGTKCNNFGTLIYVYLIAINCSWRWWTRSSGRRW